MYAIIESGNKQYKVKKDTIIDVELLGVDKDNECVIDHVLLISDGEKIAVGTPYIKGAHVKGIVMDNIKDDKVTSFKYKNKTNYHRTVGHRQKYTRIKVGEIKY